MKENLSKEQQQLATMKNVEYPHLNWTEADCPEHISELMFYDRKTQYVLRLTGIPTHRPYSVALHCYFTSLIFIDMCPHARAKEVRWVLRHDVAEALTGDLIYPIKNFNEITKRAWNQIEAETTAGTSLRFYRDSEAEEWFLPEHWKAFRVADFYELFLFCAEEYELGNHHPGIQKVLSNCVGAIPPLDFPKLTLAVRDWAKENGWVWNVR